MIPKAEYLKYLSGIALQKKANQDDLKLVRDAMHERAASGGCDVSVYFPSNVRAYAMERILQLNGYNAYKCSNKDGIGDKYRLEIRWGNREE